MKRIFLFFTLVAALLPALISCESSKSYSELLRDEEKAVNWFMSNRKVINEVPADSVFITGKDAPFYKMDEEGFIYMQVLNPGTPGKKAATDQLIYFRYLRTNIIYEYNGLSPVPSGNANNVGESNTCSFRFNNMLISNSQKWGAGVQLPLHYLPIDCEVNLVVRSYYGFQGETGACQPYYFTIKYHPAAF